MLPSTSPVPHSFSAGYHRGSVGTRRVREANPIGAQRSLIGHVMITVCALLVTVVFPQPVTAVEPTGANADAIVFNRDIRPILADNCFACHGPDKNSRKADLRLDQREAAVDSGVLIPGDPDGSVLWQRLISESPDEVMPPPRTNKHLTADQKDLLRRWIASGAEYQPHWSLIPLPDTIPVPTSDTLNGWVRNPIDAFVGHAIQQRGWRPASEATREKWLRRASFDLTGLPPTTEDLDQFLNDRADDAYERAVDRLLERPSFGERMANDWLDVARYADTYGYQADRDMHVWPWRDWCIRAFNQNLPYDQFIVWQTAGDLLPDAPADARIATAFNRLHRQTNEGGSIEEEFRTAYIADRVVTNGTAFLGLTLECARCHDHKFDPITQKDFYSLASFFAQIDELGLYSHFTETAPTPALLLYQDDQENRHKSVLSQLATKEAQLRTLEEEARIRFRQQSSAGDCQNVAASAPATPASRFAFEDVAPTDDYRLVAGKSGQAIEFSGDAAYVCQGAGSFDRVTPFSFSLWIRPADHAARRVVLHRSVAAEDAAFRGYALTLDQGHVGFALIHFWPGNAIRVDSRDALPVGQWTHVAVTYDGSSRASGLRIYLNGKPVETQTVRDQLTRDITYRGEWGDSGGAELALGARFRDVGFAGGAIDELLVFDRQLTALEIAPLAGTESPTDPSSREDHYLARHDTAVQAARGELQELRREENRLVSEVRQLMTMREATQPRQIHVLRRGAYDAPDEAVSSDTPHCLPPFPADLPRNRLGLARWMTSPNHPLVSRVAVNRFWQIFFGQGLVATASDFGSQGQPPSHPELLDWLARHFVESGWNVKQLCKLIVLSSTYRQSSVPANTEYYAADPLNRYLARGPRHRLSAEQIRDNALAISGLLVPKVGGPSVFPYQPAGLWEESGTGKTYTPSTGEGLYRRSLYTFWRRTSPPPTMIAFDATSREVCVARRDPTGTPAQALVLLNDPQFLEAARVLAESLVREQPDQTDARIDRAFRLTTSRLPMDEERKILQTLYREQLEIYQRDQPAAEALLSIGEKARDPQLDSAVTAATTVLVQTLLSFDECVTKR